MNVVITRSTPVNPDPRVEKEAACLVQMGHMVSIIGWERKEKNDAGDSVLSGHGWSVPISRLYIPCSYGGGIRNLWKFLQWNWILLLELINRRRSIDIIHACDFDTVLPAIIVKIIFKKRVVYDIFDFYVDTFNVPICLRGVIRWMDLNIIGSVDAVILAGEDRVVQIAGAKPKNLKVVLNTPEDRMFPTSLHKLVPKDSLSLIYVGALLEHRFLREMIALVAKRPHFSLTIAGWGPLEDEVVRAAAESLNIHFLGRIDYEHVLKLTSEADLNFAIYDPSVPNHRYSNPNKVYEAMMTGKPVMVARGMGIDTLVEKEGCGYVIDYDYSGKVGELLDALARDHQSLQERGRIGRLTYESKYAWSKMKNRLATIYLDFE